MTRRAITCTTQATEPRLHNLPKERYLPAEVTLENQNHVPRRGIELEAD